MNISRSIAVAVIGLSLGLGASTSANAGRLTDAAVGVAKLGVGAVALLVAGRQIGEMSSALKPIRDCVKYVSGGDPAKVQAAQNYCIQAHNNRR